MKNRIKELRIAKGMTQDDLAQVLGVSRVAVTRYENEQRNITREAETILAKTLGVNIDDLYIMEVNGEETKDNYLVETIMDKTRSGEITWELEDKEREEVYKGRYQNSEIELEVGINDRACLYIGDKLIDSIETPKVIRLAGMMYWKYGSIRSRVFDTLIGNKGE